LEKCVVTKRLFSRVLAGLGLTTLALAQGHYAIGNVEIVPPAGWELARSNEDRLVFETADHHQEATISHVQVAADANLDQFTKLCSLRLKAERKDLSDGFIEPENPVPFEKGGIFGLFYSGGERKTGRIFSAYLSMAHGDFVTIYVEGSGISAKEHLQGFKSFVTGLKRK
jgi:hypothetical protein